MIRIIGRAIKMKNIKKLQKSVISKCDGNNFRIGKKVGLNPLELVHAGAQALKAKAAINPPSGEFDAALNASHLKDLHKTGPDSDADIKKAGTQFEALLLHQMFNSMWETIPKGGMLSGSHEEGMYRDMFNEALATNISENSSIGIRDVLVKDMKRLEKGK